MENDPEFEIFIQELIELGAAYDTGKVTEDGEAIYKFNMDILQEFRPEIYEIFVEEIDRDLLNLYEIGLIDVEYNENLEATFKVSEKALSLMEEGTLEDYLKNGEYY